MQYVISDIQTVKGMYDKKVMGYITDTPLSDLHNRGQLYAPSTSRSNSYLLFLVRDANIAHVQHVGTPTCLK